MTEKEMNQLHWINKEIKVLVNQKAELESRSLIANRKEDKTAETALAIREIEELYEIKLRELYLVRSRIERYINTIEDAETRLIVRLRCINNMDWEGIGEETGYERTTVSKKYRSFFKVSHISRANRGNIAV